MKMLWIYYPGSTGYYLVLVLGVADQYTVALDVRGVPDTDRARLKAVSNTLMGLSLQNRLAVVKSLCPGTYKSCYRKLLSDKIRVVQEFDWS